MVVVGVSLWCPFKDGYILRIRRLMLKYFLIEGWWRVLRIMSWQWQGNIYFLLAGLCIVAQRASPRGNSHIFCLFRARKFSLHQINFLPHACYLGIESLHFPFFTLFYTVASLPIRFGFLFKLFLLYFYGVFSYFNPVA